MRGKGESALKKLKWILFPSFFLLLGSFCFAQTPPPGQDVAAQAERYRRESEARRESLEEKPVKAPQIEVEEKKEEEVPSGGPTILLKSVTITGMTLFDPEDFASVYQPYMNTSVTFKDLEAIAQNIKARYKEEGYLTTTAYIPEQEIKEGKVEIRVVEGKMGKLKVEGNKRVSAKKLSGYFHTKKNEILNVKTLQRDILRLNLNPDLEVKAVLSAGEEPETSDITLKVKEVFPGHIGFAIDNQGTRLVGKYRGTMFARYSDVTGNLDSFYVSGLVGSSQSGETISYISPLGTYGTKFGLDITYFETKLGKEFKGFDITGTTVTGTPRFIWELVLSENYQANAEVGLEIKSVKKKTGQTMTSDDQLRLPYAGFSFTKNDSLLGGGQTYVAPRFTFGTSDFLGASSRNHPSASRSNTGGFFFKYEMLLQRTQRMPWKSYISLRAQMQLASHTLPSSEEFQLGGANTVRGYPEGDYLCDAGGVVSMDWVFPMYLIPERWKLGKSKTPLRYQIEPVFFVDVGKGKLKKVITGEQKDKFLAGIGGGFRIHLDRNYYVRLEWATRIGNRPSATSGTSTFHLTFQSEF